MINNTSSVFIRKEYYFVNKFKKKNSYMYKLTFGLDTYIGENQHRRMMVDKDDHLIKWYDGLDCVLLILKK